MSSPASSAGVLPSSLASDGSAPGLEQRLGALAVVVLCGRVQRREAAVLGGVGVGACLEQQLHDRGVAAGGRAVQRRHADALVARDDLHLRATLEQDPGGILLAEERGEMQRREAVGRPVAARARARRRSAPPSRACARCAAASKTSSGGFACEQALGEVGLAVVERVQHGREPRLVLACAASSGPRVDQLLRRRPRRRRRSPRTAARSRRDSTHAGWASSGRWGRRRPCGRSRRPCR